LANEHAGSGPLEKPVKRGYIILRRIKNEGCVYAACGPTYYRRIGTNWGEKEQRIHAGD
jgi:hypothetical protein